MEGRAEARLSSDSRKKASFLLSSWGSVTIRDKEDRADERGGSFMESAEILLTKSSAASSMIASSGEGTKSGLLQEKDKHWQSVRTREPQKLVHTVATPKEFSLQARTQWTLAALPRATAP